MLLILVLTIIRVATSEIKIVGIAVEAVRLSQPRALSRSSDTIKQIFNCSSNKHSNNS